MAALDLIVRQGKALYIGVSNFPGTHLEQAVQVTQRLGLTPITIHQPRYNLLDRRCELDLFAHTERDGIGVMAFSPLAKGVLSEKYLGEQLPADLRATRIWGKAHTEEIVNAKKFERLQRLIQIARARGQSLAQMALAWNLRLPAVTSVLIGASKVEQITENVAALKQLEFSTEELNAIDEIAPCIPMG